MFLWFLSFPKQQGHVSHLNTNEIIHKDPIKRYKEVLEAETIDWDSFHFNCKSVKVKVIMVLSVDMYYLLSGTCILLLNGIILICLL